MLKAIKLNKRKELKHIELENRKAERDKCQVRADELEQSIESVATEAELAVLESEIDEVLGELSEHEEAIAEIEGEISEIEGELAGIEASQDRAAKKATQRRNAEGDESNIMEKGFNLRAKTPYEKRERMRQVLEVRENREFYENVVNIIKNRGVSNTDLLIPEIVIDMINIDMLDIGKIVALVTVRQIPGIARIVLSGDTPEAVWLDCCGDLSELDLDFSMLEIDCFKVGGFIAICNATLEDAFINLAVHIQSQIAKAIAVALDKAIINGTGAAGKQPTGIIPSLSAANKVTTKPDFPTLMSKFGLFPDDASNLTAVMTRKTYYTHFAPQTVATTSAGQVVAQNSGGGVRLPDGTPVVFTKKDNIADNEMLIGDYGKYFLAQRAGLQLAKSDEYRFIQDQTVFKGTARYDGRPIENDYWLLLTLQV